MSLLQRAGMSKTEGRKSAAGRVKANYSQWFENKE
jgi:hypothetical protein